ncbi:MAG: hypothetical protein AAGB22_08350, partial [Bacteroidota bacterium]
LRDHQGVRTINVPLPISPLYVVMELHDSRFRDDVGFEVLDFEVEEMEPTRVLAEPVMQRFSGFAMGIARDAGFLQPGFYDAPRSEFLVQVLPVIRDEQGRELQTPARINRATARIQISQKHFRKYTVPVRLFILLHERFHYQLPTRRERPADLAALRLYLDLGFPKTEALYAATKVFLDHEGPIHREPFERVVAIDQVNREQQHSTPTNPASKA